MDYGVWRHKWADMHEGRRAGGQECRRALADRGHQRLGRSLGFRV